MSIVRKDINGILAELGRYTLLFYFSEGCETLSNIFANISNILANIVADWDGDHNKHILPQPPLARLPGLTCRHWSYIIVLPLAGRVGESSHLPNFF